MYQSFTGSTRKPRQVNLSSRNPNPWAHLSPTQKPSTTAPGAQNTIAHAQAERLQRQQERDRLNASKALQRTWRGHSSRKQIRQKWRAEWDEIESHRVGSTTAAAPWSRMKAGELDKTQSYPTAEECFSQLRLLIHFLNIKNEADRLRLLYFGLALQKTLQEIPSIATGHAWTMQLLRLGKLTLHAISASYSGPRDKTLHDEYVVRSLDLLIMLSSLIPKEMAKDAEQYYSVLAQIVRNQDKPKPHWLRDQLLEAVTALLKPITAETMTAYGAFATEFLTLHDISAHLGGLDDLASKLNTKMLATSLCHLLEAQVKTEKRILGDTEDMLWLLAHVIHIQNQSLGSSRAFDIAQETDFIKVISLLLSALTGEIVSRIDIQDEPMDVSDERSSPAHAMQPLPLPPFVREQINSLRQQSSITGILSHIGEAKPNRKSSVNGERAAADDAKCLATYALTLLRVFPSPKKADEIRMWLYTGSMHSRSGSGISAIPYLWQAASATNVFQRILRDQRSVLSMLKPPSDLSNTSWPRPASAQDSESWSQEWRIILLFFELYTFVLKLMDDEEFLSGGLTVAHKAFKQHGSQIREGALPLEAVSDVTNFLKNLAFTLYWNASDLSDSDVSESSQDLGAYFGSPTAGTSRKTTDKPKPEGLAGMLGISQVYLKDLVTLLLRMLHERDSRRRFLPEGHWLMTNQVDMTGFIPAVVAEEEKRHEIGDEEEEADGDEEGGFIDDVDSTSPSWDRPNTFRPLALNNNNNLSRHPRQARYFEVLKRRQEKAKKKRQLASLAPRLEILRNLPFFIPFETRVQIFREFVHRDQVRRRDGFIDPDIWRMSIANSSQGRGPDGRPSGHDIISRHHAEIHRENLFEDAFAQFYDLGEGLKEPIQISFIDKFETTEAGIDGGGVTKEFLTSVTNEAFDPHAEGRLNMFMENTQHALYPNPVAFEEVMEEMRQNGIREGSEKFYGLVRELLRRYEFLGRVVGKCLYEGILVDINFAGFFLLKWALTGGTTSASNESAYIANINDLRDLDEELYQGLLKLKNYPGNVEADFSLDFTVTDDIPVKDMFGRPTSQKVTRDLISNGANIPVTNANRLAYISQIALHRLQRQPQLVTNNFLKGLRQMIQPMWLAMFNQKELQTLVGGDSSEIDIADLRRNTQYGGVYVIGDDGLEHPTIRLFWKVLKEMDDADRRKVLKFVTSTPRAPLLGFSHLQPRFSIRDSSEDQLRLPSTSTCVNLLKLPRYGDARTMRDKLLYAVNSGAGFDLS